MKGRASLPGADELFRVTSIDGTTGSRARGAKRSASDDPTPDAASRDRVPSGRQRHDEKITFYCTPEELMDLENARLVLRRQHQIAVDRAGWSGRRSRRCCRSWSGTAPTRAW